MNALGPFLAFFSSITWAVASHSYSELSQRYSAFSISLVRSCIAFLFFLGMLGVTHSQGIVLGGEQSITFRHLLWMLVSVLSSYGLGDVCFLGSARLLGVPCALAIASAYPVWLVCVGYFLESTRLSAMHWFGLVTTLLGIIVVILYAPQSKKKLPQGSPVVLGFILALLTSFLWALNGFANSHLGREISMPAGNAMRTFLGILICSGLAKVTAPRAPVLLPKKEILHYFWFFIFEACVGSSCYFYGISHSSLALGATLSSLSPVVSVFFGWVTGRESISWMRTVGVCSVVVGVVILLSS